MVCNAKPTKNNTGFLIEKDFHDPLDLLIKKFSKEENKNAK